MFFYSLLSALDADARCCVEAIYENYNKLIYEIAYQILNKHQDAEDVLEDVMVNVIKNVDRFQYAGRNDIVAQLVIYSRNAAINIYNKNKRRNKLVTSFTYQNEDEELEDIDVEDDGKSIEEIILSRETSEIVRKYINKLPAEHRDVIELVYGLGYSNIEAARVLHITPNAVGLRLFKAKKRVLKMAGGELNERLESKS